MEGARAASAADVARVAALAEAAIEELQANKGGAVWARREARVRPVLDSLAAAVDGRDQLLVVGTVDEAVVGYGAARLERLRDGGLLGVVDDLYVEPGGRGVGVGEAMMTLMVGWCEEQGCFGVDSLVLPGDRASKNFFESFGLVARAIVVHRRLDG